MSIHLRTAIAWVKGATSMKDLEAYMGHYRFLSDGGIEAYDGRTLAYAPLDGPFAPPETRLVPAEALDRFLSKIRPDAFIKVKWLETKAVFTADKVRMEMQCLPAENWPFPSVTAMCPESNSSVIWQDWLPTHTRAVASLQPFISENATKQWALCLIHRAPYAYASNNVVLARVPFPDAVSAMEGHPGTLWPKWCLDFISKRFESLASWTEENGNHWFRWETGEMCRIAGVNDTPPPLSAVARPLDELDAETLPVLTPEWKDAYRMAVSLGGTGCIVTVLADAVETGDSAMALARSETDGFVDHLPEDHKSRWDSSFLNDVVEEATRWDPNSYPKFTIFTGDGGLEGIVVGRMD